MRPQLKSSYILWYLSWLVLVTGLPRFESKLTKWVRLRNASALGCEGNMLSLSCAGEEEGLKINSAFWGRDDLKTCLPEKHSNSLKFCPPAGNTLKFLRHVCEKRPFCTFPVSEMFFEKSPCPGVPKFLKVRYDCRMMSGMGSR